MINSLQRQTILALFAFLVLACNLSAVQAFAPVHVPNQRNLQWAVPHTELGAAPGGKKKGKRKRRRKQQPGTTTETPPAAAAVEAQKEVPPVAASVETSPPTLESALPDTLGEPEELGEEDLAAISDVAKFEFKDRTCQRKRSLP